MNVLVLGLSFVLILVIAISYFMNEEGFQQMSGKPSTTLTIQPKQGSLSDFCFKPDEKTAMVQVEQSMCPPGSKFPYRIDKLTSINPSPNFPPGVCSWGRNMQNTPDAIQWNAMYLGDCNNEAQYWKSSTSSLPNSVQPPNATSCHGWDCTIENQRCVPPAPGAGQTNFICKNKKWVEDRPIEIPLSATSSVATSATPVAPLATKAQIPLPTSSIAASAAPVAPVSSSETQKVKVSELSYDAMSKNQRSQLLKDIQKIVRNEILSDRSVDSPLKKNEDNDDSYDDSEDTNLTSQGKDYMKNNLKSCSDETEIRCPMGEDGSCPAIPDMRDYIRKDKIPCWGCTIDY